MEKPNLLVITLSHVEGTYYAGQHVQGHCTVELIQPTNISGVYMQFKGGAVVSWSESIETGHGDHKETQTITKSASESYFDQTISLMGAPQDSVVDDEAEDIALSSGRHVFSFSFPLPGDLPSSFHSKHGKVTYTMKLVIRRPSKFDFRTEKDFNVIGLLDLNLDPQSELPSEEKEDEKMMCCLCCKSGPVVARLRLLRTGHILGEAVQFRATINNNSNQTISECDLLLDQVTTYHAEGDQKTSSKTVCQVESDSIEQGMSVKWTGSPEPLVVPHHLPPSKLPGCNLMEVDYTVTLRVGSTCTLPMTLTLPLTLGTLPSRYAVTGDPPEPCRPLQLTPLGDYPAVPVPGFDISFVVEDRGAEPSAPLCESKGEVWYGGHEGASAPLLHSGGAAMPPASGKRAALNFPPDIAGQPPPSYEEYTMSQWSHTTQGEASYNPLDENRV